VRDRVKASNQIHGFLLEFGISLPIGHAVIKHLPSVLAATALPARLISIIERLHAHYKYLDEQIAEVEKELGRQLHEDDLSQRLLRCRAWVPLLPASCQLSSEMASNTAVGGTLQRQSGSYHVSTVQAAAPTFSESASAETRTYDDCLCSVRGHTCSAWTRTKAYLRTGCAQC
jgi:transposase